MLCGGLLQAQTEEKEKNPRIVILLDGSSSMLHEWTKEDIRFKAAAKIIDRLMDSVYAVNKNVEFALRVYGHQSPTSVNNCFDSKLEVMFSRDNYTQMMLRLAALNPLGISPIAYSIQQSAENDMPDLKDNKYSLILITDGGESCDGDICKMVEILLRKKIDFKPYIISLVDYAPLRKQYDCMGEYLLVTKPDEIEPVVGKIVESYRHTFIQPRATAKVIETARKAPSVLKVKTPEFKVVAPVQATENKPPVIPAPPPVKKEPVVAKPPEPVRDTVIVRAPEPAPVKPSKIVVADVKPKSKQELVALRTTRQRTLPIIRFSKSPELAKVPTIIMPPIEVIPEKPKEPTYKPMTTTTAKTQVVAPPKPELKVADYSITREEAKETSLEIFFWDGKSKYYQTAPEVVLRDMKTNQPVYKFYREVDAYGNPRPIQGMPVGSFNITITGKDNFVVQNVEIRPNEKNKIKIPVTTGSLAFTYNMNPNRPMKEFVARVSVALKRNVVNKQLCTEVIPYEPENYHIEINTNPISHRNVDLDFGVTVYVNLDEPGQIKVMNPKGYRNIEFLYQHGDQYEQFRPIDVTGSNTQQEFLIQPGRYKIAYVANANPKPIVKDFIIKSNTVTEITLD